MMSSMIEDVNHLSREIGARPAGTEEERLAAMYIAENIQKRSGLPFDIEDFEGAKGKDRVFNALSIVSAIVLFVAVLLSATTIPAFIITLIIAVLLVMEYFDKPFLSNFFRFGISQNVVAKYIPAYSGGQQAQRKRKVVIVSHYDSGKSLPEGNNSIYKWSTYVNVVVLAIVVIIPIFLLIKTFAFPETSGGLTLFCVILSLLFIIISIAPLALDFYKARLLYNEGANCNASANAALIEIARQLGTGSYATDEDFESASRKKGAVVHGADAARSAGVVPDGANLEYQVDNTDNEKDALEVKEESLASAKAAIAAFTSPRKPRTQYDDEGNAINQVEQQPKAEEKKPDIASVTIDDASAARNHQDKPDTTASIPAYKTENKASGEVPDWFKSAQSKARKSDDNDQESDPGQRSRFAHTMDYMAAKQEEAEAKRQAEEEEKRAKLRAQIEAANKAAEEERKKKFAEKEKPFVESQDQAQAKDEKQEPAKEEKVEAKKEEKVEAKPQENAQPLSIDESFKKHQQENKSSKNLETTGKLDKAELNKAVVEAAPKVEETIEDKSEPTLLPEHSGPIKLDEMKQYAPLDDQSFISSNEMPENKALTELPEVTTGEKNIEQNPEYAKALKEDEKKDDKYSTGEVAKGKFGTGSFAAVSESEGMAGATGTFAPVQEELIEDASRSGEIASKDDMIVADADDSVYREGEFTDTGAFAGKGYVDMPDEKSKGFFSRFGKKKGGGKHANSGDGFIESAGSVEDNIIDDNEWEGGAFSNIANKIPLKKNKQHDNELVDEMPAEATDQENIETADFATEDDERAPITSGENRISSMVDAVPDFEEQIQEFHNTAINMEVWMVALGAEIDENSGMKAFLLEHAQELRGAIIIDLEALGAGELSLVNSEGFIRKTSTASRLKRYVRQAANKLNFVIPSVDIPWSTSSASYAAKNGFKTLRLVGMDGEKPAYFMDRNDVVENIDEAKLKQNVKYLLELIQTI